MIIYEPILNGKDTFFKSKLVKNSLPLITLIKNLLPKTFYEGLEIGEFYK